MSSMNAKSRKLHLSAPIVFLLVLIPFIIVLTAGLGTTLAVQSINSQKAMVSDKTIEMATTAAELIRPYRDEVGSIQEGDEDTPAYHHVYDILAAFRIANAGTSGELAFIYACRERADGTFEFTIDPSPDPAEFGEDLEETYALRQASLGTAAFDSAPYTDRWGTFYSAYAPVFDSNNKVVMIIGIDVWANWFDNAIWSNSRSIIIVTAIAVVSGAVIAAVLFGRLSRRLRLLLSEFTDLEDDVRLLTADLKKSEATEVSVPDDGDEVVALRMKIRAAQKELHDYIEYTKHAAYVDPLANVGSRVSYTERIETLDGSTFFGVLVVDINDLKHINDTYGHDKGDAAIVGIADVLKTQFPEKDIFRIGGDELVVLIFESAEQVKPRLVSLTEALAAFNQNSGLPFAVSASKGIAFFQEGDRGYPDVFRRADAAMYVEKNEYHRTHKPFER